MDIPFFSAGMTKDSDKASITIPKTFFSLFFFNVFSILQIADQAVLKVMVVRFFYENDMRSAFNNFQF